MLHPGRPRAVSDKHTAPSVPVNELLDFVNDKIAKTGVTGISFSKWGTIDGDSESQIMTENLTVIANKTKQLKKLQITEM